MAKRLTHEEYLKKLKENGINIIPLEEYKTTHTPIKHRCHCGNEYNVEPASVLSFNSRSCGCTKIRNHSDYLKKLSEKNIKAIPLEQYVNASTKILHRCTCGNQWLVLPSDVINGHLCGHIKRTSKREQYISRLNEKNIKILPIEEVYNLGEKTLHRCTCGKEWRARPLDILSKKTTSCGMCVTFKEYCIKNIDPNFMTTYWGEKNILNADELNYASSKKVFIKCTKKEYHGEYLTTCSNFTISNNRCPYCATINGKVHKLDSLGSVYPKSIELWSKKNKESPFKVTCQSNRKAWFKCENNKHEDFQAIISNVVGYKFRCPKCVEERNESLIQEKVRLFIEQYGYTILHERDCTLKLYNPKTGYILRYDNEIKELKLIIEVHGKQHYEYSSKYYRSYDEFKYNQWKDKFKLNKAIENGYRYIAISYKDIEHNDNYKKIIKSTIDKILEENNYVKKCINTNCN